MVDFNNIIEIQKNMASRLSQEVQMEQTVTLLMIVQGLVPDKLGRVQRESVILEAIQQGMLENDVIELIRVLVRDRTLKEQGDYLLL